MTLIKIDDIYNPKNYSFNFMHRFNLNFSKLALIIFDIKHEIFTYACINDIYGKFGNKLLLKSFS